MPPASPAVVAPAAPAVVVAPSKRAAAEGGAPPVLANPPPPPPPPTFIRVSGSEFVDADCLSIPRISGYNSFMLLEAAAGKCCGGRAAVDAQLAAAAAAGLAYVRFFAFAVLDSAGLQTLPGKYDEELLDGLDYVVAAAGRRRLRLLAVLANNWDYSSWKTKKASPDSKCWYTNATIGSPGAATGCDDFFVREGKGGGEGREQEGKRRREKTKTNKQKKLTHLFFLIQKKKLFQKKRKQTDQRGRQDNLQAPPPVPDPARQQVHRYERESMKERKEWNKRTGKKSQKPLSKNKN